jgi:hypothetical protein
MEGICMEEAKLSVEYVLLLFREEERLWLCVREGESQQEEKERIKERRKEKK